MKLKGTFMNPFWQKSAQGRIPRKRSVLKVLEHFEEAPAQADLQRKRVHRSALKVFLSAAALLWTGVLGTASAAEMSQARTTEATWYGYGFLGRRTASGERFNPRAFTAAHPTLPLGTVLEVRRPGSDDSILVRINDRCRCRLDLTLGAADALGMTRAGRAKVEYTVAHGVELPPQPEDTTPSTAFTDPQGVDLNVVY